MLAPRVIGLGQNEPFHSLRRHGRSTSVSGPASRRSALPSRAITGHGAYGQDSVKRCRDALAFGSAPIDFTTSRAHSMKRSTTGLNVRFFNMTIATGHGGIGISIGSRFRKKRTEFSVNTET